MRFSGKGALALAAALAVLAVGSPAAAGSAGFVFHSRHHIDDFDDSLGVECADAGRALVAAGTYQDYRCHLDATRTNFDLYVIQGQWVFHSRHHIDDLDDQYGVECAEAGQAVVAAGQAFTYQCRTEPTGQNWDLYVIS